MDIVDKIGELFLGRRHGDRPDERAARAADAGRDQEGDGRPHPLPLLLPQPLRPRQGRPGAATNQSACSGHVITIRTSYWPGVQGRGCGDRGPRGGLRVHQGEPQRGPRAARHQVDRGQVPRTNESTASGHVTQRSPLIGQVLRDAGRHHAGPLLHGGQPRQRHDGLRAPGTEGEYIHEP